MKFWQSIAWAEADQLPEIARFAEEVGFHGVINSEHVLMARQTKSPYPYTKDGKMNHATSHPYPDVWTSFGAMASVTKRLRFTSSVYLLPLRSPFEVARQAGTAALISNNRVAIGFGVGWQIEEFEQMGVDFHNRGKRTDEMIAVMRKLWKGGQVSHHGEFYNFDEFEIAPVPTEPVPFYCGGISPAALRRAATLCDGYVGPGHKVEDIPPLLAELKRLRREAGREHFPFETIIPIQPMLPPPSVDTLKRLEDIGMTATFNSPFDAGAIDRNKTTGLGVRSTIDQKKRTMEEYARAVIQTMN